MREPGFIVWLTGLPASGKSTLARRLARELEARGRAVEVLDGDELRATMSRDLGFSRADRDRHVARVGLVAERASERGVVAIAALVSPYAAARAAVRAQAARFVEVHVECPLEVCEARDPKRLYARARAGELAGLTGVDAPYEAPRAPELRVRTAEETEEESTRVIVAGLEALGLLR